MSSETALATTGVTLDPSLLKRLKILAKSKRRSVSGLLEEWVRIELNPSHPKTK